MKQIVENKMFLTGHSCKLLRKNMGLIVINEGSLDVSKTWSFQLMKHCGFFYCLKYQDIMFEVVWKITWSIHLSGQIQKILLNHWGGGLLLFVCSGQGGGVLFFSLLSFGLLNWKTARSLLQNVDE